MITHHPSLHRASRSALAACTLLAALGSVHAATYTWNPAVTSGINNWSDGGNWVGSAAPVSASDTTLFFGGTASAAGTQFFNNIANPFQLNSLILSAPSTVGAPQPAISGSPLAFVNNGTTGPSILQNGNLQFNFTSSIVVGSGVTLTLGGTSSGQAQLNGQISGAGSLLINASATNTWVLGTANTLTGGVTLSSGRLALLNNSALGTGTFTINGGQLRSSTTAGSNRVLNNVVNIGGNFTLGQSTTTSVSFSNSTTLLGSGTSRTITLSGATASTVTGTFSGPIDDGGNANGLTISGTGMLEFAGAAANTYTGLTTINGAGSTLVLNKTGANAIAGNVTVTSGTLRLAQSNQIADTAAVTANGTFDLAGRSETIGTLGGSGLVTSSTTGASVLTVGTGSASQNTFFTGTIQDGSGVVSLVKQGADSIILGGANTYSGGTTLNSGQIVVDNNLAFGTGKVTLNGGILRTRDIETASRTIANNVDIAGNVQFGTANTQSTLTITGTTALVGSGTSRTISASGAGSMTPVIFAGAITDNGNDNGVTILGSAAGVKVVFAGNNTYTGDTVVSAGTLIIDGSTHASSAVIVQSGATVGGAGVINGSLTVQDGGTVAPGASPETLEVGGAFNLESGGTIVMELTGATPGAGGYDQLIVSGAITLAGDLDVSLTFAPAEGSNFFLIDNLSGQAISGTFAGLSNGATFLVGGQLFQISYFGDSSTNSFTGGNDVVIQAIPEPSVAGLIALGALAFGTLRRKHRANR